MKVRDLPPEAFDKPGLMIVGLLSKRVGVCTTRDMNNDWYVMVKWEGDEDYRSGFYAPDTTNEVVLDKNGKPKYHE